MTDPVLLVEKSEGVATLTLNRPGAMNALSRDLRKALAAAFGAIAGEPAIGVVILTGAGERAFCAGLDLKELGGETRPEGTSAADEMARAVSDGDLVRSLASIPQPVIGAINGFAITGGFELALACDVLVGSTAARFADQYATGLHAGDALHLAIASHHGASLHTLDRRLVEIGQALGVDSALVGS